MIQISGNKDEIEAVLEAMLYASCPFNETGCSPLTISECERCMKDRISWIGDN